MTENTKSKPERFNTITPQLIIRNAAKAVEYYSKVFAAKEAGRITSPDGRLIYCEVIIGDSRIMLADEFPEWGNKSPQSTAGSPVSLYMFADNVDEVYKKAIDAGGSVYNNMEVSDHFYGDRSGSLIDPFGHIWTIATNKKQFSFEEMQKKSDEFMNKVGAGKES